MKEKFGKYITQIRGVSYTPADVRTADDFNAIPILRANNITESGIVYDNLVYIDKKCVKQSQLLCVGDILICTSSGSKNLVGKAARITENKVCSFGAFCKVIRSQTVDNDFLHYFFQSPYYRKNVSFASAGVNINNIRGEDIDNLEVDFFSLSEQRASSKEIGKTFDLITKRKQQLEKLDLLVKAKFYEMFGSSRANEKNWEMICGKKVFVFSSGKFLESSERGNGNIPIYGGNGLLGYTNHSLINEDTLVIGRVGAYCGNVRIAKRPAWITDNAIYIKKILKNSYSLTFLYYLMQEMEFFRFADFSGQPKITQKPLENTSYILPPLTLQREFENFAYAVQNQKSKLKQSLEKLELLKQSLLQKYFG